MANPVAQALMKSFVWGPGGAALTPEEIASRRGVEQALLARGVDTSPVGHWTQGLARVANAAAGSFRRGQLDKAEARGNETGANDYAPIIAALSGSPSSSSMPAAASSGVAQELAASSPAPVDMSGNDVYNQFIDTVRSGGVDNPYALAAIAATGRAESGFSPGNVNRTWSDPSQSGQPGTAGGIMSWRGPRYQALAATGDLSPAGQARFFLQENPQLIASLNKASSVEEAQRLMNNAWKFAGYDQPGGESARRLSYANSFLPTFQTNVAAATPQAAIEAIAPGSGYVDPMVSAPNYDPSAASTPVAPAPASFDERFNAPAAPMALAAPEIYSQPSDMPPMEPPREVGAMPVASVPSQSSAAAPAATPRQQIAQALMSNQGGNNGYFPAAPNSPGQNGPSMAQIAQALSNPFLNPGQKAVVQALMGQQMAQQKAAQEQQTWLARQQYEQAAKENDPSVRLARDRFAFDQQQAGMTSDTKEYEYAKQRGYQGSFVDFQLAQKKAGATNVTTNLGEGDKFYENLDKKNAETFAAMSDSGIQARAKLGQIDRLEGLMANAPQGAMGALKQAAGEWGIATEGLSDIQAASALLEKMVPEQRAPGSGPMSDADIKMFRASLPRILNQPGGNQLIFQTMRGIAQYEMQMGEIADQVADRIIKPSEGRRLIRELQNPLANFKISEGPTPNEGRKTSTGVQWSVD